ncbi:MAG: hypothetical protein EOM59_06195 [Clostridia bacterium]|nr:hypothetical protein [Clostridia bacterium]
MNIGKIRVFVVLSQDPLGQKYPSLKERRYNEFDENKNLILKEDPTMNYQNQRLNQLDEKILIIEVDVSKKFYVARAQTSE